MARGTQLITLVSMLKGEIGHSTLVSVGVDNLDPLKQVLRRTQETLYDEFDWPQFRVRPYVNLAAGQQFYDIPSEMNLETIEDVVCWYNGLPHPIVRGIDHTHYAVFNPADNERNDPVLNWDVAWRDTAEQIEVWPLPASDDMKLQFFGKRSLRALTSDEDVADLDDQLIVLYAAAELLARQGSDDADAKASLARARFQRLKGRVNGGAERVRVGIGTPQPTPRVATVRISS